MADTAAVTVVKLNLIDELDEVGLDDDAIGALLDSGLSSTKATLAAWKIIAGKLVMVTDVSESGSSRSLSVTFDKAKQMVDYWQGLADKEDKDAITDSNGKLRGNFITAVRA